MALEYPFELPATLFQSIGMPIDTEIDLTTLDNFGKALLIIAGADDKVSVWERGWLSAFLAAYRAPRALLEQLEDFDYINEQLEDYVKPLLAGHYSHWVRRSLLQGAIRMSRADSISSEEYEAILQTGKLLGMEPGVVNEVRSLIEIFDSVAQTNSVLLSIALKEDAEEVMAYRSKHMQQQSQEGEADTTEIPVVLSTAEDDMVQRGLETFALAVLYVTGADGTISESERHYFEAYMRSQGAGNDLIQKTRDVDYTTLTIDDVLRHSGSLSWGLKALTSVAIRTASADRMQPKEEAALLELYERTGRSVMIYYAVKGLEEVRAHSLKRLNEIFQSYS